ncbi:ATP-binding protein [Glaciecola sp. XM2]|jgi:DNA replication protein DnaC|uniref:DnaA ATPase domain-containing protein n=1 Tax=Glaciecola sp. XM2 TaxID=1914931 RepID=UPI001BDEC545|nr:ATP-binding protein [Glaciecola sp. XM2]MBT1451581.1 ATP-binding protein [Glaciecola sp. XM2]
MKSLQDRLNDIGRALGKDVERLSKEAQPFDYVKQRKEYDLLANKEVAKQQQLSKQKRIETLYGQSELNPHWTFDSLVEDAPDVIEAISIARSFIGAHKDINWRKNSAHMMIFYGDYGRGKSHIAGAIAHQLIQQFETTVLYRQLQTLLEMRFFSYDYQADDKASQQFREINKQLHDVDLLVLDEVCVNETVLKKSAQSWLGNLLRQRAANNKNCILITNHNLAELETALGRYCFESIKEYETYKVRFQGPSRRQRVSQGQAEPSNQQKTGYRPNDI